jgi:hypothetical protein
VKNLNTHRAGRRGINILVALLTSSVVACGLIWSVAHSQQAGPVAAERKFENTVPEHVPIKVKLKSEKSFKDLKNKKWARELEIEVKNTGDKPIYYLYVVIVMPDVLVGGYPLSMRTAYGRKELGLPDTPVEPDDVPVLLPGETLTVKLPEGQVRAYEQARDEEGRPDPDTVEFEMQAVKFGDGTSFRGRGGMRHREATKDDLPKPRSQLNSAGCKSGEAQIRHDTFRSLPAFYTDKPANLLRAFLLLMDESSVLPAAPAIRPLRLPEHSRVYVGRVRLVKLPVVRARRARRGAHTSGLQRVQTRGRVRQPLPLPREGRRREGGEGRPLGLGRVPALEALRSRRR